MEVGAALSIGLVVFLVIVQPISVYGGTFVIVSYIRRQWQWSVWVVVPITPFVFVVMLLGGWVLFDLGFMVALVQQRLRLPTQTWAG